MRTAIYLAVVLLVGIGGTAISAFRPENELTVLSLAYIFLAVLTFPLGFIAAAANSALVFLGMATPAESLLVASPFYARLGYIQWRRLLLTLDRTRP